MKVEITDVLMERLREAEADCPCREPVCQACEQSIQLRTALLGTENGLTAVLIVTPLESETVGKATIRGSVR